MRYQDEEFAQIERQMRITEEIRKKAEQSAASTQQSSDGIEESEDTETEQHGSSGECFDDLPTQDEIHAAVKKNHLEIENLDVTFERTSFFEERIDMKFPKDFFELKNDSSDYLIYANFPKEVNCLLSYVPSEGSIELQRIKKGILKNFKSSKIRTTWIEEGSKRVNGNNIGYSVLINHIPEMDVFNCMLFTLVKDGYVIINFNGNKTVYGIWSMIMKALMETIEVSE